MPAAAALLEEDSRNTRENAVFSARLLQARGIQRVLLVTSALHTLRAMAEFAAAGVEVEPVPVDHEGPRPAGAPDSWLPNAESLDLAGRAFKELLGRLRLVVAP